MARSQPRSHRSQQPSTSRSAAAACPCGSGDAYSKCCRAFHLRRDVPATAEQLMRSRYSAYVKRLDAYLRFTWHPDTFPDDIALDPNLTWRGLEVLAVDGGGPSDDTGTVSFVASFDVMRGGVRRPGELRELSSFVRLSDDGVTSTADDPTARWVYVEELSAEA